MEIKISYDEGRTYPFRLFIELGEYIFMSVTEFATEEDAKKAGEGIIKNLDLLDLPFRLEKISNSWGSYERNDF